MGDRCGSTSGCIYRFSFQANHDAAAFVVLPHIDRYMSTEVVNVPL